MLKVGILSDTHCTLIPQLFHFFKDVDELWHAGDIGSMELVMRLQEIAPLRAVHGNIDGGDVRRMFPEKLRWTCEGADILMTHIGGYPGKYDARIRPQLYERPPKLFISGHSHILKVQFDPQLKLLHINPGAAGLQGWQTVRTLVRFSVDKGEFKDLEVIEI